MPTHITPERRALVAEVVRLVTVAGLTHEAAGKRVGLNKNKVAGIMLRHRRPDYDREHYRAAVISSARGAGWDERLFEPWEERKARLAYERRTSNG